MPLRDALLLALQMARALGFAHQHGLIHRDVKPQYVLLNADGQAKMTDFGIARSVDVEGVTITGTVLGTSEYIAPEQARGQRVDAQTDVYSLGVVLYELLVGGVPYEGETFVTVALKHVNEPVPPVLERRPDLPPRVAMAVERAMAKSPDSRLLGSSLGSLGGGSDVWVSSGRSPPCWPCSPSPDWPRWGRLRCATVTMVHRRLPQVSLSA